MHYPVAFLNRPLAYYNNNVPTCLRATRHLHAPEYHMTFLLETIAPEASLSTEWKRLFDHLRVNSLLDYWLSPQYHDAAKAERRSYMECRSRIAQCRHEPFFQYFVICFIYCFRKIRENLSPARQNLTVNNAAGAAFAD